MKAMFLASLLAVAACNGAQSPGAGQPQPPAAGGDVEWSDYAANVHARIDGLAASKNCAGLQAEFDTAEANNAATLNRLGHNNSKLMAYIDGKMRTAGCY